MKNERSKKSYTADVAEFGLVMQVTADCGAYMSMFHSHFRESSHDY